MFSVVTLLQFLSLGLGHSSSLRLSLLSLLTNTLPGPSASEVTTLRRYTNLFIIIIIITTIHQSAKANKAINQVRKGNGASQTPLPAPVAR